MQQLPQMEPAAKQVQEQEMEWEAAVEVRMTEPTHQHSSFPFHLLIVLMNTSLDLRSHMFFGGSPGRRTCSAVDEIYSEHALTVLCS
jgi:hypothetical protein